MATYTFTTARDVVASRTFLADTTKLGYEVNAAIQWAFNRIFLSARGPDMISSFSNEEDNATAVQSVSLATTTGESTLMGVKKLALKLPGELTYTPMIEIDSADPRFTDIYDNSDTASNVAIGHPVYWMFLASQVARFNVILPAGSSIRTDFFRFITLGDLTGLSDVVHNAIISKATATVFLNLDDDRYLAWNGMAERELTDAIHVINRTVQGPTCTRPFRSRR